MMKHLYEAAREWLQKMGFDVVIAAESEIGNNHKGKKSKKNPKKKLKEDVIEAKKPSMKTSEDVISRILWDRSLQTECFFVGYLDRFSGITEKNFSAFSWEDIASVDYNVLAIPRHRIVYFKYKKMKVWDKGERLDLVFGSTGNKGDILDHIARYESEQTSEDPQGFSDTEEDDDHVVIHTGVDEDEDVHGEQDHWENKLRPNYFLCVRITDSETLEGVSALQDVLLEVQPHYAECCIPPAALHVTLCTLGLDTQEQVADACRFLRENRAELADMAKHRIMLRIEAVDHFYKRVLYGKVQHGTDFTAFVEHLRTLLCNAGISIRDNYEFVPHMTIMKTSRPVSRLLHTKDIDPSIYRSFSDMTFGEQLLDAIHLCPMTAERKEDGFYVCPESIHLFDTKPE